MSLANRLALLFAACAAAVALVAGALFTRASEAHFVELDRQQLEGKLAVFAELLRGVGDSDGLAARRPQLEQELQRHPELALRIQGTDGQTWFASQPQLAHLPASDGQPSRWSHHGADFRVVETRLDGGPRLSLLLDITHHQHFLDQMQRLIWLCVGLSALATALLGAWVARRGLRPLRQMTGVARQVSAQSLTARLPLDGIPTELRELAEAFNAMLARLEDAFARLSAFSADIAHELRTPLSNLLTQTQVTLGQPRELAEYREALHSNLEELQHLAQMVGDMLLLAKADNGLLQTRREPLALEAELTALADYFAPLAEDAGVSIRIEAEGMVTADRALLRRALSNLIDNALRFTPASGELHLRATAARIEVANQGPEIPVELQERLFDRFYRADPARREGGAEHAGLGLAIARSIVQAHGGTIRCESEGGWTRFILELPAG
ncbi:MULTISPECIES: heavy metal sensor histidine kinase [unclassified Pseudomonas]|uniref:heavy metal sensor histidine kinase n=1 Tax=unclassified Pseudomonas TaxID=196821 RepID=UPI002449BEFB|nr:MULTISPECIES: heavy metal sensor histidine kinase [unclassified Pseudomonas]MDG9926904.1 heavy metal sensor histidine kinase [Pseudomonas sp. GD04042]MDH0484645.1 heavy metal sensor histidine kinase [Pseudomonas sp. GD04015]MDH0602320.1 heavy metal sensor histidine kinase [Pseudomonas sp. GD03869]